jgi:ABC-type antimicrobial peptide transport system permease subunit
MTGLFRDLRRQRLRTLLTIAGVALGMVTLVILGSLGEHFRALVEESKGYMRGSVRLFTKTNKVGVNVGVTEEALARVRALPEVAVVSPSLMLFYDGFDMETEPLALATPHPLVEGLAPEHTETLRGGLHLLEGRWLRPGDLRQVVVARWLARRRGLSIGSTATIRHNPYEVVGLFDAPDAPALPAAIVPYEALNGDLLVPQVERATRMFQDLAKQQPLLALALASAAAREAGASVAPVASGEDALRATARRFVEAQESMFRMYEVVPRDRSQEGTRALAAAMRKAVPDLAVIDPDTIEEGVEKAVAMFLVISLIVTTLSTVVGGLLVVNTMAMAVLERRREIGIKAAIGATPAQIALEFVLEAGLLGLLGAVLGVVAAVLAVHLFEPWLLERLSTGYRLFLITPRLVAFAIGYGVSLGVVAGGVPALRAARVDPAIVLREL